MLPGMRDFRELSSPSNPLSGNRRSSSASSVLELTLGDVHEGALPQNYPAFVSRASLADSSVTLTEDMAAPSNATGDTSHSASGRPTEVASATPIKAPSMPPPDLAVADSSTHGKALGEPPQARGTEKRLNGIHERIVDGKERSDLFDLSDALKSIARGGSTSDILPPLRAFLVTLEALTEIHPFIAISVLPFRAILNLELNRRTNDRRILTLISQMADMLQQLTALPREGMDKSHAAQFGPIFARIKQEISDCGNAIDLYYKSRLIVRIIKSLDWQSQFETFAETFVQLKDELRSKISIATHIIALSAHAVATSTAEKVDQVAVRLSDIFEILRGQTALEKDIEQFIERFGPIDTFIRDNQSLARLVKKVEGLADDRDRRVRFGSAPRRSDSGYLYDPSTGANQTPLPQSQPLGPPPKPSVTMARPTRSKYPLYQAPRQPVLPRLVNQAYKPYTPRAPVSHLGAPPPTPSIARAIATPLPPSARPPGVSLPSTAYARTPRAGPATIGREWGMGASEQDGSSFAWDQASNIGPANTPSNLPRSFVIPQTPNPILDRTSARKDSSSERTPWNGLVELDGSVRPTLLEEYRYVISVAVETKFTIMLRENQQVWVYTLKQFEVEIKAHIDQGTRKVLRRLSELSDGAHARINEPALRRIWEAKYVPDSRLHIHAVRSYSAKSAQKWSMSVEGPKLVQSLQDYLTLDVPESERWALQFLGVAHRTALLHTIDPDYSGFVSVDEANAFTGSKPEGPSLLVWLAYSATRWSYEANECHRRILEAREKITNIIDPSRAPGGPDLLDVSLGLGDIEGKISGELELVLLGSLRVSQLRISAMIAIEPLKALLESGINKHKQRLVEKLDSVRWEIFSSATLRAIVGAEPIENYVLLLSDLLITKLVDYLTSDDLDVNAESRARGTHAYQQIFNTSEALLLMFATVDERVFYLRDAFPGAAIEQFAFGLFSAWTPRDISVGSSLPKLTGSAFTKDVAVAPPSPFVTIDSPPLLDPKLLLMTPSPVVVPTIHTYDADGDTASTTTTSSVSTTPDAPLRSPAPTSLPNAMRRPRQARAQPTANSSPVVDPSSTTPSGASSRSSYHTMHAHRDRRSPFCHTWYRFPFTIKAIEAELSGLRHRHRLTVVGEQTRWESGDAFSTSHSIHPFFRVPSPTLEAQVFEGLTIIQDLAQLFKVPIAIPREFSSHDTYRHEWHMFISDIVFAFQPNPVIRLKLLQRALAVQAIIDAWNHNFFMRRQVFVRLRTIRPRRRRPAMDVSGDSDSSLSEYGEAEPARWRKMEVWPSKSTGYTQHPRIRFCLSATSLPLYPQGLHGYVTGKTQENDPLHGSPQFPFTRSEPLQKGDVAFGASTHWVPTIAGHPTMYSSAAAFFAHTPPSHTFDRVNSELQSIEP